jgi:hypothetical protein
LGDVAEFAIRWQFLSPGSHVECTMGRSSPHGLRLHRRRLHRLLPPARRSDQLVPPWAIVNRLAGSAPGCVLDGFIGGSGGSGSTPTGSSSPVLRATVNGSTVGGSGCDAAHWLHERSRRVDGPAQDRMPGEKGEVAQELLAFANSD